MEFAVQRKQIRGAVAEMMEEGAFCHPGVGDDEIDTQAGEAGPLGQPQARVDERFSGSGHRLRPPALRPGGRSRGHAGTLTAALRAVLR